MRLPPAIALAVLAASVNAAPPESVRASYDVHRNGLPVAVVQETYEKTGARYRIVSESNPTGLLALFVRTRVKVQSSGAVTPAGLRPESVRIRAARRRKQKRERDVRLAGRKTAHDL